MAIGTELVVVRSKGGGMVTSGNGAGISRPRTARKSRSRGKIKKKISRLRKPEDMSLEAWQIALRREYGRKQKFRVKNVGREPIFSEYEVTNPQTKRTYRVAIRGERLGDNYCSCPDFAVNSLGTCKHIESTLARLGRSGEARRKLAAGFQPRYSEIYVRYGAKREVVFRPGSECPAELARSARPYFDGDGCLRTDAYLRFHTLLKRASAFGHDLRCYDDALGLIAEVRDRRRRIAASAGQRCGRPGRRCGRWWKSRRMSIASSRRTMGPGPCGARGPPAWSGSMTASSPAAWRRSKGPSR